jgi:DNA-binding transcriptional ArsR family regulator
MDAQLVNEIELLYEQVCHALSDPKRLIILYALSKQPRYVSELATELDIPQPTVSRHLKILRERSLVATTREGNAVYYSLTDDRLIDALDLLRGVLRDRVLRQAQLVEFTALDTQPRS